MSDASARRRWTVAGAARRGDEILREQGLKGLLYGVLAQLGYRRLWIFELGLGQGALGRAVLQGAPPEAVEIGELRGDRQGEYLELRPSARPDALARRLRCGHRCFVARLEGRIVSAQWAAFTRVPNEYLGDDLALASHEACSYDSFTAPEARARGLGQALRTTMILWLHEAGYRRLLAMVLPENLPAVRLVEKLGYERIGTMHSLRLGRMSRKWFRMASGRRPPGLPK
jgi:GNAT superfamily N-acetyltransferase